LRRINAILGAGIIILLLIHVVTGIFQLSGIMAGGSAVKTVLSFLLLAAVGAHAVIGIKLTFDTVKACRKSGKPYFKNNERFWLARISGFAILILVVFHIMIFKGKTGEAFRLNGFFGIQLAAHIMLVLSLIIHLVSNIKPLFIAFGIADRKYIKDILIVLSLVMLAAAAAFVVYYLRWNTLWMY